jgi:HAD superfamily hydrolase (TIGR01509 family)
LKSAVIFDCDGVLTDNELVSCSAALAALTSYGISTDLGEVQSLIGKSNRELLEYYQGRDEVGLDLAELDSAIERQYFRLAQDLRPMPGVVTLLEGLKEAGVPVAVASSGSHAKIGFTLEKIGLKQYFPIICSASEVKRGKPEPDLFLYTAQKLNRKPGDCIVVEDSLYGVQAAQRAWMTAVGLVGSFSRVELLKAGADVVIEGFDEFAKKLSLLS